MISADTNLVSCIIPVYNRAAYLKDAVRSVLSQTHRAFELILVDDGSTDGTADMVDQLANESPEVVRVIHQKNSGPGPAREAGRQIAHGEFIQYLDSDDLLQPQKFELQVAALNEHPGADIAYGVTRLIDSSRSVLADPLKWSGEDHEFLFPGLLVDRWWSTHTPLWRSCFCQRVGPWSSLRYSEDWEYEARAGALKAKLIRVPHVVCDVRQHDESRETTSGRWLAYADQVLFFQLLYTCAMQAEVSRFCPEMMHFVRWVFASSRAAGRSGDTTSARALLTLARSAAVGKSLDMAIFGLAARLFGWKTADLVIEGGRRMLGRRVGPDTQCQSWMKGAPGE